MATTTDPRGELRQTERWLRANFPTALPVRVRVCRLAGGLLGVTNRRPRYFTISIERLILPSMQIPHEVLLHEWAHAFTWRPHLEGDPVWEVHHDDEWALAYGRIYRAYFDDGGEQDAGEFSARRGSGSSTGRARAHPRGHRRSG